MLRVFVFVIATASGTRPPPSGLDDKLETLASRLSTITPPLKVHTNDNVTVGETRNVRDVRALAAGTVSAGFSKFKAVADGSTAVIGVLGGILSGSTFSLPSQTTAKGPTVEECERWQPRKPGALDDASHIIGAGAAISGALSFLGPITAGISAAFSVVDGALGLFKEPKKDLGKMAMQCQNLRFQKMERWVKAELAKLHKELDVLDASQFAIFGSLIQLLLVDMSSTSNRTKHIFSELAYGVNVVEAAACADGTGDCVTVVCEAADVSTPAKCSHPPKPLAWPGQFDSIDLQTLLDLCYDSKRVFDTLHALLSNWAENVARWRSEFTPAQVAGNAYVNEAGGRLFSAAWSVFASATVNINQLAEAIVRVMKSYATSGPRNSKSAFNVGDSFDFSDLLNKKEKVVLPTGWDLNGVYGKWLNPSHPESLGAMFLNATTAFVEHSMSALPDKYSFVDTTPPSEQKHFNSNWALRFCALPSGSSSGLHAATRADDTGVCFSRNYDDASSQPCRQPCDTVPDKLQYNVQGPMGDLRRVVAEWPTCRGSTGGKACLDLYDDTPDDACKSMYVAEAVKHPRCATMMLERYASAVAAGKLPTCEPMMATPGTTLCKDQPTNPDGTSQPCTGIPGRDFNAGPTCDANLVGANGIRGHGCWTQAANAFSRPPEDAMDYLNRCVAPSRQDESNGNNLWYETLASILSSPSTRAAFQKYVLGNLVGQVMPVIIAGNSRRNLFGQLMTGSGQMVAAKNANHEVLPISGYTPPETPALSQLAPDAPPPAPPPFTLAVESGGACTIVDGGTCVTSPNFPNAHGTRERCVITGFPATKPRFDAFDVEDQGSCAYDDLTINGIRFCGHWKVPGSSSIDSSQFFSSSQAVKDPREVVPQAGSQITWKADHSVQHKGFKMCWDRPTTTPPPTPTDPAEGTRAALLNQWLAPVNGRLGRLCSSQAGGYHMTFDTACGGEGKLLVIVTTTDGKVFGGYMPVSWKHTVDSGVLGYSSSRGAAAMQEESKAFLFTLAPAQTKFACSSQSSCLYTHSQFLGWGGGVDMYLGGQPADTPSAVWCSAHTYWNGNDVCGSKQAAKVEVYQVDSS